MSGEQTDGRSYIDLETRMEDLVGCLQKPEMEQTCRDELEGLERIVGQILNLDQPDVKGHGAVLRPKATAAFEKLEACLNQQRGKITGDWFLYMEALGKAISEC